MFDRNSDGYIDEQELQQTMKELGVKLTSDDVTAMFAEAGCKDQRRITYEGCFLCFLSEHIAISYPCKVK